ncbi:carbohydrate esterase family 16 protein [Clavulina sp. PMI_390]|nr:carbohydrate esterase family 16 protein [Clavulina sp. PMI_390]
MLPAFLLSLVPFVVSSAIPESRATVNDGISLAISAASNCGAKGINFSAATVTSNVNAGVPALSTFKTIVGFGDSYTTDGKTDGSTPAAAVLTGTSPKAGGRTTNGLTWIEDMAADVGAKIMDYAHGGDVVNASVFPSAVAAGAGDFVGQYKTFSGQNNALSASTTLYAVFFGINDYSYSKTDGGLSTAATDLVNLIKTLAASPTNARNFLVLDLYGRGSQAATGQAWKLQIFKALGALYNGGISGFHFAYVDLEPLWEAVLGTSPGYAAFGYTSSGACTVSSATTVGECSDPAHTFYRPNLPIDRHPSKETHRIMANYVEEALTSCTI